MAAATETTADTRYIHIRLHKKLAYCLLAVVALSILTVFLHYFLALVYRAQMGELVDSLIAQLSLAPQTSVEAKAAALISNSESLEQDFLFTHRTAAHDGTIVLFSPSWGTLIVLRPQVGTDGKVEWTCWGGSAYGNETLPTKCRIISPAQ
jgi:hypothetical protein